jgi:hypothetical protein
MTDKNDEPRKKKTAEQIRKELEAVSPLALTQKLTEYEIADMQSSLELLDEVYSEFSDDGGGAKGALLEPLLLSTADGFVRSIGKEKARKWGISTTKIVHSCREFSYDTPGEEGCVERHDELMAKGQKGATLSDPQNLTKYNRKEQGIFDQGKMDKYKDECFGNRKTAEDQYGSDTTLRHHKNQVENDKRIKDKKKHSKTVAETDHIVPLSEIHRQFETVEQLTKYSGKVNKKTRREIANLEKNYALTSNKINNAKRSSDNSAYVISEKGNDLNLRTKASMVGSQVQAQAHVAAKVAVAQVNAEAEDVVRGESMQHMGELVNVLVIPMVYEAIDIFKNGICYGMGTDSPTIAIARRFKRAFKYIMCRVPDILKSIVSSIWDVLKDIVFSVIAGIFKKFIFVVKEGIKVFFEAIKILSIPSAQMSSSQKGNAITKLLLGVVSMVLADLAVKEVLDKFIPIDWLKDILAGIVSAMTSSILLYLFDKLDLFSVKSELRLARVREVFDARILDIKESTRTFDIVAHETLKAQRVQFEEMREGLTGCLEKKDMLGLNKVIDGVADFLKVDLPYKTSQEFLHFVRDNNRIVIGC